MKNDNVNYPSHYTDGKYEVLDFIEERKLNFSIGNAVKYIARAGKKDPNKEIEDLSKARFYVNREIKRLEKLNVIDYRPNYIDRKIDVFDFIEDKKLNNDRANTIYHIDQYADSKTIIEAMMFLKMARPFISYEIFQLQKQNEQQKEKE